METFVRIRNQNELKKFEKVGMTQEDCGLIRNILVSNGKSITKISIDEMNNQIISNLFTVQFENLKQREEFNLLDARKLIKNQENVANPILIVPLNSTFEEFISLQKEFNEKVHTVTVFPEMDDELIIQILDSCCENEKVTSVEFYERESKDYIEKIVRFGILYSSKIIMGLINIRLNSSPKYSGTSPEIYYSGAGYKYFSKQIFTNARAPKEYKKFNTQSLMYDILTTEEINLYKQNYGSKWNEVLYCENFIGIHKTIKSFSEKSLNDIKNELRSKNINTFIENNI